MYSRRCKAQQGQGHALVCASCFRTVSSCPPGAFASSRWLRQVRGAHHQCRRQSQTWSARKTENERRKKRTSRRTAQLQVLYICSYIWSCLYPVISRESMSKSGNPAASQTIGGDLPFKYLNSITPSMRGSDAEIDLYEATISEIQDGLENVRFTSTHLVKVRWTSFLCLVQCHPS